ncbi:MAG: GAF domain-containing sensor histidine kinase [Chloroflexi bacterium]|nr:GAF domain-containing sensor histidine kinase [Chloroflexota bacterium]
MAQDSIRREPTIQELETRIAYRDQRIAALEALQEIATTLTTELRLDRLLALILSSAVDVMKADAGSLLLHDPQTNELVFEVVQGGSGKALLGKRIRMDQGLAGWVFTQRKPATVQDAEADQRHLSAIGETLHYRTYSLIAAPLIHKNDAIGVLEVINKKSGERFNTDDQELLMAFASQSAVVIDNARLYQQVVAERDRILAVEEQVRRELARELHDGPSQILAAIIMSLRFFRQVLHRDPSRVEAELAELERQANLALRQVRGMLFDLRPVALETQGLAAALQAYVERQSEMRDLQFHLDTDFFTGRFPSKVEAALFSIVQEAVVNVEKHAQAKNVWISLRRAHNRVVITVQDDGRGFELSEVEEAYAARGHLGLLNMKERAELANAALDIESNSGKGTTVTLTLKLDESRLKSIGGEPAARPDSPRP